MEQVSQKSLLRWAESLAAIAKTGMGFTESLYEQERFEEILSIAADIKATALEVTEELVNTDETVVQWLAEVGKGVAGYQTPKVAVGAAVRNDKGELLLIQRSDSGVWLYPTGWCDVGYSAPEVVVKEVREETGIEVRVDRLIGVLDGMRLGESRIPLYSLVFLCTAVGGELNPHPLETLGAGWFSQDNLPEGTLNPQSWSEYIFAAIRGEHRDVFYDDLRTPVWRKGSL
jgi:ADP-ribose pyrophosphatase YjhB (NUDIX family)